MIDNKNSNELRDVQFELDASSHAEGACLIQMGQTRVLCCATVEEKVPPFLVGRAQGWVTAEYGMLPRSTHTRMQRERSGRGPNSRALEISRLIGRSLRVAVDMQVLGERTITLDCDVLKADGGTRCCAINGAMVALHQALSGLVEAGKLESMPLNFLIGAVSVGIVGGQPVLDLDYAADSSAEVDMNVVMTAGGKFVELQGTAEKNPFATEELNQMLELAQKGINQLISMQEQVLGLG